MSRREYKVINRRLQQGRLMSVKEGKYLGNTPPYGYNKIKLENEKGYSLKINEESKIIKYIFNLYVNEKFSINEIVKKLNKSKYKTRSKKEWTSSIVREILKNPIYIGKIRWNARKIVLKYEKNKIKKTRPRNKEALLFDGIHEPIIKLNIWEKAQLKLTKKINSNINIYNTSIIKNPLSGIIYCKQCGSKMQRKPIKDKEELLICNNSKCNNISSKLNIIENQLIKSLNVYFENDKKDFLNELMKEINHKNLSLLHVSKQKILNEKFIKEIKVKQRDLKLQEINLYNLLEKGIYDEKLFENRKLYINEQLENIDTQLEKFKNNEKEKNSEKDLNKLIYNDLFLIYNNSDISTKNLILKTILKKVEYNKTKKVLKKIDNIYEFELIIYPYV